MALILVITVALRATTFAAAYWLSCLFETDQADRMSLMYGLGMDDNGAGVVLPSIHRTEAALLRLQGRRDAYDSKAATDTSPRREVSLLQEQSILRLAESKELLAESLPFACWMRRLKNATRGIFRA